MPYTERMAEAFLQAQEQQRQQQAQGVRVQANGPTVRSAINWPEGQKPRDEDPLFSAIAGNSKEYVGGIPKNVWDSLSPEEKDKWNSLPKSYEKGIRAAASGIGGVAGGLIGGAVGGLEDGPAGALIGGFAGAGAGGSLGYDLADDLVKDKTPPSPKSRDDLRNDFESAKGRE